MKQLTTIVKMLASKRFVQGNKFLFSKVLTVGIY